MLRKELAKALKRKEEQARVLDDHRRILANPGMESLKAITRRRMPRLEDVFEESCRVVAELQAALQVGSQPDLLEATPPPAPPADSPTPPNPRRR